MLFIVQIPLRNGVTFTTHARYRYLDATWDDADHLHECSQYRKFPQETAVYRLSRQQACHAIIGMLSLL